MQRDRVHSPLEVNGIMMTALKYEWVYWKTRKLSSILPFPYNFIRFKISASSIIPLNILMDDYLLTGLKNVGAHDKC